MRRDSRLTLAFLAALLWLSLLTGCAQPPEAPAASTPAAADVAAVEPCLASASWITAPHPPEEIGNGTPVAEQTNCQFYQFAWQWFLDLVQPESSGSDERVFETLPILVPHQKNQCASTAPTGKAATTLGLFVRTTKGDTEPFSFILPGEVTQAGDGDLLYDQDGNVVFYNVRYDPTECQATSSGFLPGTMELKTSWRQITAADTDRYYSIEATVESVGKDPILLGLVGFHLVRNTPTHPEFVWATFEHRDNVPDCEHPQTPPASGWSFTSAECAQCLAENGISGCGHCKFNQATPNTGLTGAADEICRVFSDGTGPDETSNNVKNRANIDALNRQLVGKDGFLTKLGPDDPMSIWKNYINVGGLWTNGGTASSPASNQRGSLNLANTTMETFLQSTTNCFSCHDYDPSTPLNVSHIVSELIDTTGDSGGSE